MGFAKVALEPGEARTISVAVDPAATHHPFGVWSCEAKAFVVAPGDYTVFVGTSSEDTPFTATVTMS